MMGGQVKTGLVLFVYGLGAVLCERLSVQVLCLKARDEAGVARDVLSLKILSWAADPVGAEARGVAKLNDFTLIISGRLVRV
jgi:hypothetical protein